jgi:two-component system, chemotaxis family, sensor kinase CheA
MVDAPWREGAAMEHIDAFKGTFFQECDERLADLEAQLLALKTAGSDAETLHAAFRSVHSIKGGAGMFGFRRLVAFAHTFEALLDLMREGTLAATTTTIDAALRAADVMADLVHAARGGIELPAGHEAEAVRHLAVASGTSGLAQAEPGSLRAPAPGQRETGGAVARVRIEFRPHRNLLRRMCDPLSIVRQLSELGTLEVAADLSALPPFEELEPTDAYLAWVFVLETRASLASVAEVFEFVEGDCALTISPVPAEARPVPTAVAVNEPLAAGGWQAPASTLPTASGARARNLASIRVDIDRIDRLFDLVGEIAVARAVVAQQCDHHGLMVAHPRLFQGISELLQLTARLHDSVTAIRAQPVRSIFARMPRLVRDLATATGKDVRLEMSGEATEIDKTVIEELSDPLTHMIRNAVDHGIEPPAERLANDKPAQGTIRLSAEQRGNQIVIQVSDDGRGIARETMKRLAQQKGLIASDAAVSDEEIDNLVFLPGFSTAEKLSDISGRGVGMDVVRRNIQQLGGRIALRSEPGRGCKVVLTLPLTLAVLPGMIVRVGPACYVVPLASIIECVVAREGQVRSVPGSGEVLALRGEIVPLVRLRSVFHGQAGASAKEPVLVVEGDGGQRLGLSVDEILGQQQVVIKSLRENVGAIAGIAGATILGDGSVALILDVDAMPRSSAPEHPERLPQPRSSNRGKLVA